MGEVVPALVVGGLSGGFWWDVPLVDEGSQARGFEVRELQLLSEQRVGFDQLFQLQEHDVARGFGVAVFR